MKRITFAVATVLATLLATGSALAYGHANRWGGNTSHSYGSTSHSSAFGTSSSHTYGEGTSHSNYYGGSTSHSYDGGTTHTNAYGGTTSGQYGYGAEHTTPSGATTYGSAYHTPAAYPSGYYGYHPPTTVNYYGAGCYNCGSGWATAGAAMAGAAVGVAAGAAMASSSSSTAATNAYAQGYNAGAANASTIGTAAPPTYAIGSMVAALPAGCLSQDVKGKTYYLCGNTWFNAAYGANGVYYTVVSTP